MDLLRELLQGRFRFGDGIGVVAVEFPYLTKALYCLVPKPCQVYSLPLHPYLLFDQGPFIPDMEVVKAVFEMADT